MLRTADPRVVQRWLKAAGAVCFCSLLSAAGFCVGCTERQEDRMGHAHDATTYGLAVGADLCVLIFMIAATWAVLCLGYLLSDERRS
jgi:hypothetical protein